MNKQDEVTVSFCYLKFRHYFLLQCKVAWCAIIVKIIGSKKCAVICIMNKERTIVPVYVKRFSICRVLCFQCNKRIWLLLKNNRIHFVLLCKIGVFKREIQKSIIGCCKITFRRVIILIHYDKISERNIIVVSNIFTFADG